jgi:cytochrome P450
LNARDFEAGLLGILINIFPSVTFPKAFKARAKLQKALIKYYSAKHDLEPDVSQLAKVRAGLMRKRGILDEDVGKFELALLHVSTANASPTLFWHLCFILANPETTSIIRKELESIISFGTLENGNKEASIDITKFDSNCPVLVSSYRETIRLANAQVGARRVVEDTIINDGKNDYLLKAGCDVQLPSGISHLSESAWGADAASFNPDRFLTPEQKGDMSTKARMEDREQKKSYIPFGGGKHLCPGRQFAFAEILGAVAVLVMGFDVKDSDGGLIKVPLMGRPRMGEGIAKPTGDGLLMGAKITRREGWEDIVWKFTC